MKFAIQIVAVARPTPLLRVAVEKHSAGNVLDRGLSPRRRGGFSPAVDVYYVPNPPRAVVRADLAGIDPGQVSLEISGRELILSGHREPDPGEEDRVYQQPQFRNFIGPRSLYDSADHFPTTVTNLLIPGLIFAADFQQLL